MISHTEPSRRTRCLKGQVLCDKKRVGNRIGRGIVGGDIVRSSDRGTRSMNGWKT